jgi:hypothetical protein
MTYDPTIDTLDDEVLESMLAALEQALAERGWDAPWTLWGLALADGRTVAVLPLCEGATPHPADTLMGLTVPDDLFGVALVTEAWAYPPDVAASDMVVPPSEHPDRRELRLIQAVLRDGRCVTLSRFRGDEAATGAGATEGRITNLLRRSLGLDAVGSGSLIGDVLTCMWLAPMAEQLVSLAAGGTVPDDRAVLDVVLFTDPYTGLIQSGLLEPDELAAARDELSRAVAAAEPVPLTGSTDSHDSDGLDRLRNFDEEAAAAEAALIDPVPAGARALLDERLGGIAGLWNMACASGVGPFDTDTVVWMGPEVFAHELLRLFDDPADLIATVDAIAPLGGVFVRAVLAVRGWSTDLPAAAWADTTTA